LAQQFGAGHVLRGAHHGRRFTGGEMAAAQYVPLERALGYVMDFHAYASSVSSARICAIWSSERVLPLLTVAITRSADFSPDVIRAAHFGSISLNFSSG